MSSYRASRSDGRTKRSFEDSNSYDRESFPLSTWDYSTKERSDTSEDNDDLQPVLLTRDEEQQVVSKLDRRLVLFVALLYMLSFLDRSSTLLYSSYQGHSSRGRLTLCAWVDIGNAKAAGMEADLGLTEAQFHWILDAFYVTYIIFEFMTIW